VTIFLVSTKFSAEDAAVFAKILAVSIVVL